MLFEPILGSRKKIETKFMECNVSIKWGNYICTSKQSRSDSEQRLDECHDILSKCISSAHPSREHAR